MKFSGRYSCHEIISVLVILLLPAAVLGGDECTCDFEVRADRSGPRESLHYKLGAIASILVAGALGVGIPILGRRFQALKPENDIFFMIKAFAAGVILATGFIHILPDAFQTLNSPCLPQHPWREFPFPGLFAMLASVGTLMIDTFATSFYTKMHFHKPKQTMNVVVDIEEANDEHAGHLHVHTHATHGHAHGAAIPSSDELQVSSHVRQRIISQVLELGIVVHSVVIGISLGTSQRPETIKPLLAALSFHQFFEGMGLGGCISQAKFKSLSTGIMAFFFSLTAPVGIGIGIGVSSTYSRSTPAALITEGTLNAASAGILIYMALVDLLAADFMNPRMQSNFRLQLGAQVSLLLGVGCMSVLAKWA